MKKNSPAAQLARRRWATTGTTEAHAAAARENGKKGGAPIKCGKCGVCANCVRRAKRLLRA